MSLSSTSTSNRQVLARVCRRAGWFLLPLLVALGFCEAIFWRAGECWPSAWVLKAFEDDPQTLYGPRYFAPGMNEIKLALLQKGNVKVLALGSSRVTQFRAPMFVPMQREFLNAGLMTNSTRDLVSMAALFIEGKLPAPRVIIVGIDPWWMKQKAQPDTSAGWLHGEERGRVTAAAHLEAMRRFLAKAEMPWLVLRPGAARKDAFYGYPAIGLGALSGNCYRTDGSVLNCSDIADYLNTGKYRDRESPPVIERIRTGGLRFGQTPGMDWKRAGEVIAALTALQAKGIEIYGFLPPFSTECDQALQQADGLSAWYQDYRTEFLQRMNAAGIVCVDVRSPATYGLTDDYMIDGFHPGDVLMTHIVEELVRRAPPGSTLSAIDLDHLRQLRQRPGVIPISLDPPPRLQPNVSPSLNPAG